MPTHGGPPARPRVHPAARSSRGGDADDGGLGHHGRSRRQGGQHGSNACTGGRAGRSGWWAHGRHASTRRWQRGGGGGMHGAPGATQAAGFTPARVAGGPRGRLGALSRPPGSPPRAMGRGLPSRGSASDGAREGDGRRVARSERTVAGAPPARRRGTGAPPGRRRGRAGDAVAGTSLRFLPPRHVCVPLKWPIRAALEGARLPAWPRRWHRRRRAGGWQRPAALRCAWDVGPDAFSHVVLRKFSSF